MRCSPCWNRWCLLVCLLAMLAMGGCQSALVPRFALAPATPTQTASPSPTVTRTFTAVPPTRTATPTQTATGTATPTGTFTPSPIPPTATATCTPTPARLAARVLRVLDGDTIEVDVAGSVQRVRYLGIDAPESSGDPWAEQASAKNREWVDGQTVWLEQDTSDTDQYGRLLRYVYMGELFVNAQLVRLGLASCLSVPPDVRHAAVLAAAEQEAQRERLGQWGDPPTFQSAPTSPPPAGPAVCDCSSNCYNCKDFKTYAEAQACFDYCWQVTGGDVHHLDGDKDGSVCESLP